MQFKPELPHSAPISQCINILLARGYVVTPKLFFQVDLVKQIPRLITLSEILTSLRSDRFPDPFFVIGVAGHTDVGVEVRIFCKNDVVKILALEAEGSGF